MFKKTLLAVALASASLGAQAVTVPVGTMTVTGGQFGMGFFTGGGFIPITGFGSGAANIANQYNAPGWNVNAAQGPNGGPKAGTIGEFNFGAADVNTFTALIDPQSVDAGGHPMPSGNMDLANGATSFNISSFYANWNTTDFNQGNAAAVLTTSGCVASGCNFSMAWQSLIVGGPFNGQTGSWVLTGTVNAVPEASTYGMMIAGLGLVGLAARRRKSKSAR